MCLNVPLVVLLTGQQGQALQLGKQTMENVVLVWPMMSIFQVCIHTFTLKKSKIEFDDRCHLGFTDSVCAKFSPMALAVTFLRVSKMFQRLQVLILDLYIFCCSKSYCFT